MSRVIKRVVYDSEKPLQLKEVEPKARNINEKLLNKAALPRKRFHEDGSRQLLEDALAKTREIIEKSKLESEELISKALVEKHKIEKKAFDEGYKKGVEAALKQQEVVWSEYITELNIARQKIFAENAKLAKRLEKECLKLSIEIAEKILDKKLQIDEVYYLNLISKGLKETNEEKNIIIRVSESNFERINASLSKLKAGGKQITLLKDPFLSFGDCIIEGSHFEIDVGIDTQIENINSAFEKLGIIDGR